MLMMTELLNLPAGYEIHSLNTNELQIHVTLSSTADQALCPLCQTVSSRLHSRYLRRLVDVPCGGRQVILHVRTQKWRCAVATCPRRIFAERLDPLARAWARMTTRLVESIQSIGLSTNGEGGARLAERLGMTTSPSTVLNRLLAIPDPVTSPPEEIGLDEWSFRRGKRFGTIIVDLQRRKVIDLLPDRESATVAAWLKSHPTIRVVSRDRSREFATAVTQGAPQAKQVLDRFHLLRNLVEKLPAILERCFAELRRAAKDTSEPESPRVLTEEPPTVLSIPESGPWKPALTRHAEAQRVARQANRNTRYVQVQAWHEQGLTAEEIGQRMGMKPRTVRHWLKHFRTDTRRRKRASEFDQYADYVRQRWQSGCHNGLSIWRELQSQGYSGSPKSVYQHLRPLRQKEVPSSLSQPLIKESPIPVATITPSADLLASLNQYTLTQTQWLFVTWPDELEAEERDHVDALCRAHSTLAGMHDLVQQFRKLVHERTGEEAITKWINACKVSKVKELVRFAKGLREEWDHVVAGLTHPASNGQTEGQVHKLKLIKRQHYGRAGFPLLRKHMLNAV